MLQKPFSPPSFLSFSFFVAYRLVLTIVSFFLLLFLTACGGGQTAKNSSASPSNAPNLTTPQPVIATQSRAPMQIDADDFLTFTPFSSWYNLKTDFGARGDGVTDDTAALQAALTALGQADSRAAVLFIPRGTYNISSTLHLQGSPEWPTPGFGNGGVRIQGEDPQTTILRWTSTSHAPMLIQNGGGGTRYSRLTWDGQQHAWIGVAHWWDTSSKIINDASPEHVDEVFKDMDIGIMAGRLGAHYGQLNSEGHVRRVAFYRMGQAGLSTGSFNALDWWVWDSTFEDCYIGLTNVYSVDDNGPTSGAGGFHGYRNVFRRSRFADISIANTGFFSFHHNYSKDSQRFFYAQEIGSNNASVILHHNRIFDTVNPVAIYTGNLGPLQLIDNIIGSRPSVTTFAVEQQDWAVDRAILSTGNTFTVAQPIRMRDASDRLYQSLDTQVTRASLDDTPPVLPSTPVPVTPVVYEIPPGSTPAAMQTLLDQASAHAQRVSTPVVAHFARGTYLLNQSLRIPAGSPLILMGDGWTSSLIWNGPNGGVFFELDGPSQVTLQDLHFLAFQPSADLARISRANQPQGRIASFSSLLPPLYLENLTQTRVALRGNGGIGGIFASNSSSILSTGLGGLGPSYLKNNSRALFSETWYEGVDTQVYTIQDSSEWTYINGEIGAYTHMDKPMDTSLAPISLHQSTGLVTFIGWHVNTGNIPSGTAIRFLDEQPQTDALFMTGGSGPTTPNFFFDRPSPIHPDHVSFFFNKGWNDMTQLPNNLVDTNPPSSSMLQRHLTPLRSIDWNPPALSSNPSVTNVRFYGILAPQTSGIRISDTTQWSNASFFTPPPAH